MPGEACTTMNDHTSPWTCSLPLPITNPAYTSSPDTSPSLNMNPLTSFAKPTSMAESNFTASAFRSAKPFANLWWLCVPPRWRVSSMSFSSNRRSPKLTSVIHMLNKPICILSPRTPVYLVSGPNTCMDWRDGKHLFGDIVYGSCRIGIFSHRRSTCRGKREVRCLNEWSLWNRH